MAAEYEPTDGVAAPNDKENISSDDSKHDDAGEDAARTKSLSSQTQKDAQAYERNKANAILANPLRGYSHAQLRKMGRSYAYTHALVEPEDLRAFELGAVLAQNPAAWERCAGLRDEEKEILRREFASKWAQPLLLYLVIALCSACAAVQGMDETVVNGAQLFYSVHFGISGPDARSTWLLGLTNSAPYLGCALLGSWLAIPLNTRFGRRGTVFITCVFSALACCWQGFTNTWWHMFVARFALGLGIGPKSATVPIYAAECAPPEIRGALVMQWQCFTAFGIMCGYAADLALYRVPDTHNITGLNWRLMMASAMLPAVLVVCFVFLVPESPRWYMSKNRHASAFESMCRLRFCKLQAARDQFYMHKGLEAESATVLGRNKFAELITVPRNRRAMQASELLIFCGINVIAYYSSAVFVSGGFSELSALAASLGFGIINFLFAIPAIYTIDTFGRRNLLLATFPLMSVFLLFTGFAFWIPDQTARVGCIALGIYLFGIVYSPGGGPVPFTYSAEAYPLYVRTYGMSLATATTWFFNFVLSISWPSLLGAFKPQGAFGWYAAWNMVGWFGALTIMPETKARSLEELDAVFSVPTHEQVAHGLKEVPFFFQRYILRRDVEMKPLIDFEKARQHAGETEEIFGDA
ncbi:hypothetical protein LTR08_004295 [Meristemomyces frigidus]|nr:hypothetical protein LTR08_004295 [Meristemomyces frigidus]